MKNTILPEDGLSSLHCLLGEYGLEMVLSSIIHVYQNSLDNMTVNLQDLSDIKSQQKMEKNIDTMEDMFIQVSDMVLPDVYEADINPL
jgi:N-methylhydantoinase B/oxoprolinase/acetone carboxylase alpha subunit